MSQSHFTWFDLAGVPHDKTYVAANIAVTGILVAYSLAARVALGSGEKAIQPAGKLSLKGFSEALVEFVDGMIKMVLGDHGKHYIPLFGSIFFFILFNNLFGLLPGPGSGRSAAFARKRRHLALGATASKGIRISP